ncbi:MAG: hypothetical protein P4L80_01270 [Xanthobacteraceae bacterium]|nr:hypothetical protein [Xanthobacteraceae bacterium]
MIRKATVVILLVAIFAAAALTPASDALAATRYDGAWSLVIYTRSGPCDQSYRLSGQIVNGVIVYDGIGANVTGRVGSNGAAFVRVTSGSSYAVASGRLTTMRGAGTWRGRVSNGFCAGIWAAMRT